MFQTPVSRVSRAPIGRTLSCSGSGDEDDKENRFSNKSPPGEPNLDARKRNHKRGRDEEGEGSAEENPPSPCKTLEPRALQYPDDDALGRIASMKDDDGQEEVVPLTQPYPPESPQPSSQAQETSDPEEGECTPDSQLGIAG